MAKTGAAGALVGIAMGAVVLGVVTAAIASRRGIPPVGSNPPKPPPKPTTPKPGKPTAPPTLGKENTSTALTANETASLAEDHADLLAAWGIVSPHKVYVQAIAQKLAAAGDTRAADVNARLANWAGAVTYAGLPSPEADIVASPIDYTFDQIAEQGLGSDFPNFKTWAAHFLMQAGHTEPAQMILDQMAATKAAGL